MATRLYHRNREAENSTVRLLLSYLPSDKTGELHVLVSFPRTEIIGKKIEIFRLLGSSFSSFFTLPVRKQ